MLSEDSDIPRYSILNITERGHIYPIASHAVESVNNTRRWGQQHPELSEMGCRGRRDIETTHLQTSADDFSDLPKRCSLFCDRVISNAWLPLLQSQPVETSSIEDVYCLGQREPDGGLLFK